MGVSIDYWTTAKINATLQHQLKAAADEFVRSRRWWAESSNFFPWPGKDGHLAGSTKFSRSDADVQDDLFMADVEMLAILNWLASWSAKFGIDWEVHLAGEKWGEIRGGKLDSPLKKFCTQAKKSIGKPAAAKKRMDDIFREYDGAVADKPTSRDVKQLQARWTEKQIQAINQFIAVEDSSSALMRNQLMERRPLPAGLVPTYEEGGTTWHDLRGFPLQRSNAVVADHVDFSYCKAPRPKNKNLPGTDIIMTNCQWTDCRFAGAGPFYSCGHRFLRCDFTGTKLRGANLGEREFHECNFTDADLGRVEVGPKNVFKKCLFERTRFAKLDTSIVTFTDCIFRACDWSGANLAGGRFKGCDVRGENFTGTDCPRTAFDGRCQTDGMEL